MAKVTKDKLRRVRRWEPLRPQVIKWLDGRPVCHLAWVLGLSKGAVNRWFNPDYDNPPTDDNMDRLEAIMRCTNQLREEDGR